MKLIVRHINHMLHQSVIMCLLLILIKLAGNYPWHQINCIFIAHLEIKSKNDDCQNLFSFRRLMITDMQSLKIRNFNMQLLYKKSCIYKHLSIFLRLMTLVSVSDVEILWYEEFYYCMLGVLNLLVDIWITKKYISDLEDVVAMSIWSRFYNYLEVELIGEARPSVH